MSTIVKTEGQHKGEFLASRGPGNISFDQAVLTHGQVVKDGRLLSVVADKLVASTGDLNTEGDSDEVFAGFAYGDYDATDADTPIVIVSRLAEVKENSVVLHEVTGGTAASVTAAVKAAIAKLFLIVRA